MYLRGAQESRVKSSSLHLRIFPFYSDFKVLSLLGKGCKIYLTRKCGAQRVNVAEICALFGECDKGTMAGWWQDLPSYLFCGALR